MTRRMVLTDGHVIPGDGSPELFRADVLIEDGVISAVTPGRIPTDGAEVLAAAGMVVMPGLVDGHRHVWQAPFRGIGADMTLPDYFGAVLGRALSAFEPEDARAAALLGAAEALDAGITTVFDWSNSTRSPAHTDAVADGYAAAGIRAVIGHGRPGDTADVRRLAGRSGPVTGGIAALGEHGAWDDFVAQVGLGRELGLVVSAHAGGGSAAISRLDAAGLLGPWLHLVHLNSVTRDEAGLLADRGVGVTVTPIVEGTMGHGASAYGRLADAGCRVGLGTDVVVNAPPSLFESLRDTLRTERLRTGTMLPAASVLPAATRDSATAIGLGDRVGSLTVGKRADVILLDGLPHLAGTAAVAGAVVAALEPADVRTVLVDGQVVKRDGVLVRHDLAGLRAATAGLLARSGQ